MTEPLVVTTSISASAVPPPPPHREILTSCMGVAVSEGGLDNELHIHVNKQNVGVKVGVCLYA